ncbi:MAG: class I SAM-dependent methyltransferase family protein [Proteobacteria bacterium]|nr:class I SAM-dependent methyltransferase family protein [Pseudomonadota bacterium]
MDWQNWHGDYDRPNSLLARRLQIVQAQIRTALDNSPPGPLRIVSLCAGQGRDLLEVLADHPRRDDVHARLVELDERNTARATQAILATGLKQVEVVTGDASLTDRYRGMVPADLVLACGLFGNITDDDVLRTIAICPQLCRNGARIIWTRHRRAPDRVPKICGWFEAQKFEQIWLTGPDLRFCVGVHRFAGKSEPLITGTRMFSFVGSDVLRQREAPIF